MHMCIILCVFMCTPLCTRSAFLSGISFITLFLRLRASSAIVRAYTVNSFALVYTHVYRPMHYEEYYSKRTQQTDHSRACRTQGAGRYVPAICFTHVYAHVYLYYPRICMAPVFPVRMIIPGPAFNRRIHPDLSVLHVGPQASGPAS